MTDGRRSQKPHFDGDESVVRQTSKIGEVTDEESGACIVFLPTYLVWWGKEG
jgi:hypothetical protein